MKLKFTFIVGTFMLMLSCKQEDNKIPITINISNNYNTYISEIINFINENEYAIEDTNKVQHLAKLTKNYHDQLIQHKADVSSDLYDAYDVIYKDINNKLIPTIDRLCRIEDVEIDSNARFELDKTVNDLNQINDDLKFKQQSLKKTYLEYLKYNNIKNQ